MFPAGRGRGARRGAGGAPAAATGGPRGPLCWAVRKVRDAARSGNDPVHLTRGPAVSPTPPDEPRSPHAYPLQVLGAYAAMALVLVGLAVPLAGSLLPETRTVTASGRVEASPGTVWTVLVRVGDYPGWREAVERILPAPGATEPPVAVPADGPGLARPPAGWVEEDRTGSRVRYRVVRAEAPERLVLEVREAWPPYRGRRVVRLTGEDGGTRIFVGQRGSVESPLFRIADRYLASSSRDPGRLVRELAERIRRR